MFQQRSVLLISPSNNSQQIRSEHPIHSASIRPIYAVPEEFILQFSELQNCLSHARLNSTSLRSDQPGFASLPRIIKISVTAKLPPVPRCSPVRRDVGCYSMAWEQAGLRFPRALSPQHCPHTLPMGTPHTGSALGCSGQGGGAEYPQALPFSRPHNVTPELPKGTS